MDAGDAVEAAGDGAEGQHLESVAGGRREGIDQGHGERPVEGERAGYGELVELGGNRGAAEVYLEERRVAEGGGAGDVQLAGGAVGVRRDGALVGEGDGGDAEGAKAMDEGPLPSW